jgi:hypothetical protein
MSEFTDHRFEAVNAYALDRLEKQGDVYGWAPLEGDSPQALLLVSQSSPVNSFPSQILGIKIILKPIDPPEMDVQCGSSGSTGS